MEPQESPQLGAILGNLNRSIRALTNLIDSHPSSSSSVQLLPGPSRLSTGSVASQPSPNSPVVANPAPNPPTSSTRAGASSSTSRFRGTGLSSAINALSAPRKRSPGPLSSRMTQVFEREVMLLVSSSRGTTLSNQEKSNCGRLWRKDVTFTKTMTAEEVRKTLFDEYGPLLTCLTFTILMPVGKFLRKPPLSDNKQLDGKAIFSIFKQKIIYLRPSEDLWDVDDDSMYVPSPKLIRLDGPDNDEVGGSVDSAILPQETQQPEPVLVQANDEAIADERSQHPEIQQPEVVLVQGSDAAIPNEQPEHQEPQQPEASFVPATDEATPHEHSEHENVVMVREPDPVPFFPKFSNKNAAQIQEMLLSTQDTVEGPNERPLRVSRCDPFHTAVRAIKRPSFKKRGKIFVRFFDDLGGAEVEEEGFDLNGPTREFFSLVLQWLHKSSLFEGPNDEKTLSLNFQALQAESYYYAGVLIGMSILLGGPSPNFFSMDLIHLLRENEEEVSLDPKSIDNNYFTFLIEEINQSSGGREELVEIITKSLAEVSGAVQSIDFSNKEKVIEGLTKYFKTRRIQAPMEQFSKGLADAGLLPAIRRESLLPLYLFSKAETPTADEVLELFKPCRTLEVASNRYAVETKIIAFWSAYLDDCEDGITGVTIPEILMFGLGVATVPPMGFAFTPISKFLHGTQKVFPEAHTCNLEIDLPTSHLTYESFQKAMTRGLKEPLQYGQA